MPHRPIYPGRKAFARHLRKNTTNAEGLLWWALRNRQLGGSRFRRQAPFGPYILDFLCPKEGLVVELDGSQHDEDTDRVRDAWLESRGLRVIRFGNGEVFLEFEAVLDTIWRHLHGEQEG
jgi:very-short-patch-repair endonuclease